MTTPDRTDDDYRVLVQALATATRIFDNAADDRVRVFAAVNQLMCVMLFLQQDETVKDGHLVRPLGALAAWINDKARGASVPALDDVRPVGKPTGTTRSQVAGVLAACAELLVQAGRSPEVAIKMTTSMARSAGLRTASGKPIIARQVRNWRNEAKRGPRSADRKEDSRDTFDHTLAQLPVQKAMRMKRGDRDRRTALEALAAGYVEGLAVVIPRSAADVTRRLKLDRDM